MTRVPSRLANAVVAVLVFGLTSTLIAWQSPRSQGVVTPDPCSWVVLTAETERTL